MPSDLTMEIHEAELTKWEWKLADLLEQYWLVKGRIPTFEQAAKMNLSPHRYKSAMTNRKFREQLARRGLGVENPDDPKLVSWALTERQLVAANIMLDLLDNRSRKRKLDALEIPTQEYQAWLRDPAFQLYLKSRSEVLLKDNLHEAHMALVDRVRTGDVNAIKYFNELTGRHIPAGSRADAIDPMDIIQKVIEILQVHLVDDPDKLKAVANALMGIMGRAAVGHEIDNATAMAHDSYGDVSGYGSVDMTPNMQDAKEEFDRDIINVSVPREGMSYDKSPKQITEGTEQKDIVEDVNSFLSELSGVD